MEDDQYGDSVTTLLQLLRAQFGQDDTIKSFYEGDPIQIPDAAYPAIIVEKVSGQINFDATSTDIMTENLIIKIVMNKKEDFNQSDEVDMTEKKLRLLVEGRDAQGHYGNNTILKLIRTMATLNGKAVGNTTNVSYDVIPLGGGRARSEADITVTLKERILVLDRQS